MPDTPRWASRLAAAVSVAAIAVLLGRIAVSDWLVTSDQSVIVLRALDVGGPDTPLVGPYSRFGWNHPGPSLAFALAPFAHLTRAHEAGVLAGTLLVNVAALVTLLGAARRRDPLFLALTALVTVLFVRAVGTGAFIDPWNPYVIVLPALAVAICAATVLAGDAWMLIPSVAFASFVAQTHVGGAPIVLACIVPATGLVAWRAVRGGNGDGGADGAGRSARRALVIALLAGAVMWLPAVVEQFTADGTGNLTALWKYFTADHVVNGVGHGWDILVAEYAIPGRWATGHEAVFLGGNLDPGGNGIPVALALLVGALVVSWRRHDGEATAVCALALVLGGAVGVAASRVVEPAYPYLLRWTGVAGALTWLAIGYAATRALAARIAAVERYVTLGATVVTAAVAALVVVSAVRTPFPEEADELAVRAVLDPVMAELRDGPEPVLVSSGMSFQSQAWAGGIRTRAERAGIDVRTEPGTGWVYGDHRVDDGSTRRELLVVAGREQLEATLADPGLELVASHDRLTADERAELDALLAEVDTSEKYERFVDEEPDAFDRLRDLNARDQLIGVFVRDLTR